MEWLLAMPGLPQLFATHRGEGNEHKKSNQHYVLRRSRPSFGVDDPQFSERVKPVFDRHQRECRVTGGWGRTLQFQVWVMSWRQRVRHSRLAIERSTRPQQL